MSSYTGAPSGGQGQNGIAKMGVEDSEEKKGEYCKIECAEFEWGSDVSQLLLSFSMAPPLTIII